MMPKIKTEILKEGNKKVIELRCPDCGGWVFLKVLKGQLSDNTTCSTCGCKFWWSIQD